MYPFDDFGIGTQCFMDEPTDHFPSDMTHTGVELRISTAYLPCMGKPLTSMWHFPH